jgi:hypothetical protein
VSRSGALSSGSSGAWLPNHAYKAGDVVNQGGVLYAANADFTSGTTFNTANWTVVAVSPAAGDARYDQQYPPGVCTPQGNVEIAAVNNPGLNLMGGGRVIVPRTGTLRDLMVFIGTASGNVRGAVYDIGATTNAVRTRIWDGASTPATTGWMSLGDPALPVVAGTHLDFAVMADNTAVTIGRRSVTNSSLVLPAGFATVGGCLFKPSWGFNPGSFASAASMTEGNAGTGFTSMWVLIARVV